MSTAAARPRPSDRLGFAARCDASRPRVGGERRTGIGLAVRRVGQKRCLVIRLFIRERHRLVFVVVVWNHAEDGFG